ncbi:sugar phosphate isomerase/epimerase family protein [Phreatobacter sp.]|uniref:sugar phosphate isomerase/epimerase family protein n=1 Tax=Phreatobacter sp. TaxID=1966341 RepID=UPI003F6EBAAC
MTQTPSLPVLGAALPLDGLRQHRDWILDKQRDLEIQDFFWAEVLNGDWRPLAETIRKELDGYKGRLGIHGPFWGFSIASMDPDVRDVVRKRMAQGLDVCAALGATQMVIHSPYTTWDANNLDSLPGAAASVVERTHDTLREAVRRAEDMGVVLVIENIEDKEPHQRVALARSFDSPAVRVSIDTGHANYAYGSTGAPPVDFYVTAAGEMLNHVHLQDTDGHADRHWNPGEGNIAWRAVFHALQRIDSNPRLILEVRNKEKLRAGADYLIALGVAQ